MERHCGNCGAVVNEGYRVCGNCGSPVEAQAELVPAQPDAGYAPVKSGNNKNLIFIGAAVVAVIAIVAIIIGVSGNGYKKPIKAMAKAYEEGDFEDFIEYYNEDYIDWYEDLYGGDFEDSLDDDSVDYLVGFIEEECGEGYKVKVEYKDKEKYKKDDIEDFVDEMEDEYGLEYKADDIKNLYELEVLMTAKGDEELELFEGEIYVGKIDGDWYILWEDMEMCEEDDFDKYLMEEMADELGSYYDYY